MGNENGAREGSGKGGEGLFVEDTHIYMYINTLFLSLIHTNNIFVLRRKCAERNMSYIYKKYLLLHFIPI